MMSELGRLSSALHSALINRSDELNIDINVIGTIACALAANRPLSASKAIPGMAPEAFWTGKLVPYFPFGKLNLKKRSAVDLFAAVKLLPTIAFRPASTAASQACCSRVLLAYMRPMSNPPPIMPISGTTDAAMIRLALPAWQLRKRANGPGRFTGRLCNFIRRPLAGNATLQWGQ